MGVGRPACNRELGEPCEDSLDSHNREVMNIPRTISLVPRYSGCSHRGSVPVYLACRSPQLVQVLRGLTLQNHTFHVHA